MVVTSFLFQMLNLGALHLMVVALPRKISELSLIYIESTDLMVVTLYEYVLWVGSNNVGIPLKNNV